MGPPESLDRRNVVSIYIGIIASKSFSRFACGPFWSIKENGPQAVRLNETA